MAYNQNCSIYADDGQYYPLPVDCTRTSTVTGGIVTFYLTDDKTATGNAIYTKVFLSTMQISVPDASALFQAGAGTLSSDLKTLTVPINRFTISTSAVTLLGVSVLGSISQSMTAAPNGTVATLMIEGVV